MISKPSKSIQKPLVEGEDFYFNAQGLMVFTENTTSNAGIVAKAAAGIVLTVIKF